MDLDELKRLVEASTPGPWRVKQNNQRRMLVVCGVVDEDEDDRILECEYMEEDAAFIAAARDAIPQLIALLEHQRARAERLEAVLAASRPLAERNIISPEFGYLWDHLRETIRLADEDMAGK